MVFLYFMVLILSCVFVSPLFFFFFPVVRRKVLFLDKNKVLDWISFFQLRAALSRYAFPPAVPSQGVQGVGCVPGAPLKLGEPHSRVNWTEAVGLERPAPFLLRETAHWLCCRSAGTGLVLFFYTCRQHFHCQLCFVLKFT